ncbi:MAG TPA: hypothetical protein VFP05_14680 [Thermomicrobiales bacterium]|nr:hypothetical protein [Thermomicrobiales bacterium]
MNRSGNLASRPRTARAIDAGWVVVLLVISLWVFHRLGAFDLWSTVARADGTTVRIVKTFGGVDHPFHATRADLLRHALLDGELLRWISAHQGGYPVEFYPLGAPAFETGIWALFLGTLPMMAAHKIAIIVIFLLPAAGFLLLAQLDKLPLGVGVLALAFHLSARGWWWSGGYMELVDWGLVSSFLAMVAVLLFLPIAWRAIRARSARWGAAAAIVASFAVYTNVRSFLPLGAVAVGTLVCLAWESDRRLAIRGKATIAVVIVTIAGLVTAPLLIAILRFQDLYYFVVYQKYGSFGDYWHASISAVSGPIFVLAIAGLISVFALKQLAVGRLVAFTLAAHVLMTILLSDLTPGPHIEQLEAVRLMPFQRALAIYLAALGVYAILTIAARLAKRYRIAIVNLGMLATAIAALLLYVVLDSTPIHASDRGMYPVLMTGESYFLDQQEAVELADARAEPGTAILVLGSMLSWHDQFWSFQWSDRPFFFNDWLWYWQTDHFGQYDPETEHAYPDPASTLDNGYLQAHGIGAVVVSQQMLQAALASPLLQPILQGSAYSVFLVENPTPIITADGAETTSIEVDNQRYAAVVSAPATTFEIRRNWFPRWTATVDGKQTTISKDDQGYMVVTSETPGTRIEIVYGIDGWDWLGRLLLVLGVGSAAVAILQPRRVERLLRLDSSSPPA